MRSSSLGGVSVRQFGSLIAAAVVALACVSVPPPAPQGAIALRADVSIQALVPGVWRHVSYQNVHGWGRVPSNGLVVRGASGALIIDTAWNPEQTAAVLSWAEANVGPISAVVVTHAHHDRVGGLAEVQRRGIPSYALAETVQMAAQDGWPPIDHGVTSPFALDGLGVSGELLFPGSGHTADNSTVWLSETRVLAGGCLVRESASTTMGNTSQADLEGWPRAIATLQQRYRDVSVIVPGHGEPGGLELLAHTRELLGKDVKRTPPNKAMKTDVE
jgi:glyoxylase-like metal-dependent hydrolase (beta-lactamase superfamily II)